MAEAAGTNVGALVRRAVGIVIAVLVVGGLWTSWRGRNLNRQPAGAHPKGDKRPQQKSPIIIGTDGAALIETRGRDVSGRVPSAAPPLTWPVSALYALYLLGVVGAAAWFGYGAATETPAFSDAALSTASSKWIPAAPEIAVWCLGLLALAAVPVFPAVGLMIYLALMYGFVRDTPEWVYMYRQGLPVWICGLTAAGCLVRMVRYRITPSGPHSKLVWLMGTFVLWALISSALAGGLIGSTADVLKYHPVRYIDALLLALVAAYFTKDARAVFQCGAVLGLALAVRAAAFPDYVHLDGDLAALIVIALPLCVGAVWGLSPCWQKASCGAVSLSLLWTLYATQNRGAAVAVGAALLVFWLHSRWKWQWLLYGAPCVLLAGLWLKSTDYGQRFAQLQGDGWRTGSAGARLEIWQAGWHIGRENWFFGVGPSNFTELIGEHTQYWARYSAHNTPLAVWIELGIVGLALYSALFGTALVLLWRMGRGLGFAAGQVASTGRLPSRPAERVAAQSALIALTAYLTAGMFLTRPIEAVAYILVGFTAAIAMRRRTADADERRGSAPLASAFEPVVVLGSHGHWPSSSSSTLPAPNRWHYTAWAVFFVLLAVYGSLVPLNFRPMPLGEAVERFREIPFFQLSVEHRADWVANILLYIPIGFCLLAVLQVDRPRGIAERLGQFLFVTACCTVMSIGVEFTQLWFPPRTVSQNDMYAQLLGGLIGASFWMWGGQALTDWLRLYTGSTEPRQRFHRLLDLYMLGLFVLSVMPLDLTISPAELYQKFAQGRIQLSPFSQSYGSWGEAAYLLGTTVLLFVPVGVWSSTVLVVQGRPIRSAAGGVLICFLAATAIEAAQLLVYSRYTSTADILLGTLGGAIGIGLTRLWYGPAIGSAELRRASLLQNPLMWLAPAAVYAVFLALLFWAPFEWTDDGEQLESRFNGFWVVPFSRLYWGTEYNALMHILRKVLWFAPLGVIFAKAVSCTSPRPRIRAVLLVLAAMAIVLVGALIELGQVLLPNKHADVTDVLLSGLGGIAGLLTANRLFELQNRPVDGEEELPLKNVRTRTPT